MFDIEKNNTPYSNLNCIINYPLLQEKVLVSNILEGNRKIIITCKID